MEFWNDSIGGYQKAISAHVRSTESGGMLSFERESSLVAELATPILIEGYWVPFFEEIGELKAAAKVLKRQIVAAMMERLDWLEQTGAPRFPVVADWIAKGKYLVRRRAHRG